MAPDSALTPDSVSGQNFELAGIKLQSAPLPSPCPCPCPCPCACACARQPSDFSATAGDGESGDFGKQRRLQGRCRTAGACFAGCGAQPHSAWHAGFDVHHQQSSQCILWDGLPILCRELMAPLPPKKSLRQMLVDMGIVSLPTDGFAMCITIRMCANRHASRRPNTRSHPPMKRARSDRRAVSFSGGSYLSQDNGYAAWAKLWCLSLQWQRKTTRATSLGDARSAGKIVSEVPRMIFAKFACDAMWTTSTRTALSQTLRSCHTPRQWRCRAR